jgi:exopolysaccharide production protein ExoZ
VLRSVHGLRFVAAFAVLVFHSLTAFGPPLTGSTPGAAGVDLFFVISGFVIGYVGLEDDPVTFLMKRLIRVVPLYWLATAAYVLILYYLFKTTPTFEQTFRSLFLIPDFSQSWYPIYYPGWTLCYEMAFYLVFSVPLLWTGRRATVAAAAILAGLSAIPIPVPFASDAVFGTPLCLEFVFGLLIAEAIRRGHRLTPAMGILSVLGGIGLLAMSVADTSPSRAIHWGIPAAMIVLGALGLEDKKFWRARLVILGGDASYAIYLSHVSVMTLVYSALEYAGFNLLSDGPGIVLREFLLLGSALAGGTLIHLWIERPMLLVLRYGAVRARLVHRPGFGARRAVRAAESG